MKDERALAEIVDPVVVKFEHVDPEIFDDDGDIIEKARVGHCGSPRCPCPTEEEMRAIMSLLDGPPNTPASRSRSARSSMAERMRWRLGL